MIEVGTKVIGNWGAGHSYSYGVVTAIREFHYEGRSDIRSVVVVDFDDIDAVTHYWDIEILFADSIDKIGVYVDHEGMVY